MDYYGLTDIGSSRRSNQDTFRIEMLDDGNVGVFIVCDGMGGAKAGNVASWMAAEVFTETVRKKLNRSSDEEDVYSALRSAVVSANKVVYKKSETDSDCYGMGTTLVAAVTMSDKLFIANVGDSRAYKIRGSALERITRDHSIVEDLVERGDITRLEARSHPRRNIITRAVGTSGVVFPDIFVPDVTKGDIIMLCSDGLSNVLSENTIAAEIENSENMKAAAEKLIDVALLRGAPDNVTVVLFNI